MIQDNHRPIYHHLPDEGLLWDPCAAVFRNGRYHLFYLHDSWAAGPSKRSDGYNYKAWAHVSSPDLVHWERHRDAIARGQTGNLFDWNGTPVIVFPHPDGGGASCFASNPAGDLERWRFDPRSAVLRHPVQGNSLYPSNNDVTAWQEGEWCYVLTGTRDGRYHLFYLQQRRHRLAGGRVVLRAHRHPRSASRRRRAASVPQQEPAGAGGQPRRHGGVGVRAPVLPLAAQVDRRRG